MKARLPFFLCEVFAKSCDLFLSHFFRFLHIFMPDLTRRF